MALAIFAFNNIKWSNHRSIQQVTDWRGQSVPDHFSASQKILCIFWSFAAFVNDSSRGKVGKIVFFAYLLCEWSARCCCCCCSNNLVPRARFRLCRVRHLLPVVNHQDDDCSIYCTKVRRIWRNEVWRCEWMFFFLSPFFGVSCDIAHSAIYEPVTTWNVIIIIIIRASDRIRISTSLNYSNFIWPTQLSAFEQTMIKKTDIKREINRKIAKNRSNYSRFCFGFFLFLLCSPAKYDIIRRYIAPKRSSIEWSM